MKYSTSQIQLYKKLYKHYCINYNCKIEKNTTDVMIELTIIDKITLSHIVSYEFHINGKIYQNIAC